MVSVVVFFPSLERILGECTTIHSLPMLFLLFFFRWRLTCTCSFHSIGQNQSTVAQRAEMTVAKCSLTSCVSAHSDFAGSRVYACLGVPAICTFGRVTRVFYMPLVVTWGQSRNGRRLMCVFSLTWERGPYYCILVQDSLFYCA